MNNLLINYVVLIVGLILIGAFWRGLARNRGEAERKSVNRWTVCFFVLGVVMFTIQYFVV
ncbi:MAG: hypothetical protein II682_00820 [Firmicutes bacterium]|nr:hypothetical protein [Bacillota bacterium]